MHLLATFMTSYTDSLFQKTEMELEIINIVDMDNQQQYVLPPLHFSSIDINNCSRQILLTNMSMLWFSFLRMPEKCNWLTDMQCKMHEPWLANNFLFNLPFPCRFLSSICFYLSVSVR